MIQDIIISKLIKEESFSRKVLPFIKEEYFEELTHKVIFSEIRSYIDKYEGLPESSALKIEIEKRKDVNESTYTEIVKLLSLLDETQYNREWLLNSTEKWCKERAIYLALMESIKIADEQDKTRTKDAIPSIMSDALGVCFDDHIGHDYLKDAPDRYDLSLIHISEPTRPY